MIHRSAARSYPRQTDLRCCLGSYRRVGLIFWKLAANWHLLRVRTDTEYLQGRPRALVSSTMSSSLIQVQGSSIGEVVDLSTAPNLAIIVSEEASTLTHVADHKMSIFLSDQQ